MHVTITTIVSEDIQLTDAQVKQIAISAILKKMGLTEMARLNEGVIYDDHGRLENLRIRQASDEDISAFATISLLNN
jgi:hypothetical protein